MADEQEFEYGFAPRSAEPEIIFWYLFGGIVNMPTLESAKHAAVKSFDDPVYFHRVKGTTDASPVDEADL